MHWFFAHVYVTGLTIAAMLLLTGAFVVTQRVPVSSTDSENTWGGASGASFFSNVSRRSVPVLNTRVRTEEILEGQVQKQAPYAVLPVGQGAAPKDTPTPGDFQWEALLAEISGAHASKTSAPTGGGLSDLYAFIPSGLISPRYASQERTEEQDALFEYGNVAGSYIRGFDDAHQNMLQILKDAYQDRGNQDKVAAAERVGSDYVRLGEDLEVMDAVPQAAQGMHLALAKAYKIAGQNLITKLRTKNDQEFLTAVNTYNASVDQFQKSYIALVTLFAVAEVEFSQTDPGSVFMFQSTLSF